MRQGRRGAAGALGTAVLCATSMKERERDE